VSTPDAATRQLIAAAACMLDQGRIVDGLSRVLTAAALIVLLLPVVLSPGSQRLPTGILAAVALLGAIETFLAVRVRFDAALFHRLSTAPVLPLDFDHLDKALVQLGLVTEPRPDRSAADRVAGAARLMHRQAAILGLQACLAAVAAFLCQ
jgi:hypothetical protein